MAPDLVAIHQPNFFPWLGWWNKLARADTMILLDDAQFQKGAGAKGGNWANRVRALVGGKPEWITVPVNRSYHGTRTIAEMEIDESRPWRRKLIRTMRQSYSRASCFEEVVDRIEELISADDRLLADFNERALRAIAEDIGLDPSRLVRSSELGVEGRATERLIGLVRGVGGRAYLGGGGAAEYEEEELFREAGIELVRQEFQHPQYPQLGDGFEPGLSVIDALMGCGFAGTRKLIAAS
jgi:hypothetical protein